MRAHVNTDHVHDPVQRVPLSTVVEEKDIRDYGGREGFRRPGAQAV